MMLKMDTRKGVFVFEENKGGIKKTQSFKFCRVHAYSFYDLVSGDVG